MDPKLLELLVCPVTKGPLTYDREAQELVSRSARLAYPVRDGIPVLLENEARTLTDEELERPFTVLIPARMASSRLPDKPLADIAGLPMVVRVAQRAAQSAATRVVVAADDARILQACQAHGVQAIMTRPDHASGSDRLAEACTQLGLAGDDIVVNVQGDEPLMDPALINAVAGLLPARPEASMGTAAHAIASLADVANPNVVKVVLDAQGLALYFSRAPIPHWRDQPQTNA
eukprot:gene44463-59331_t